MNNNKSDLIQNTDAGKENHFILFRFGSDTTRAMLSCQGSSGVFSQSLRPEALDKIRSLETGKIMEKIEKGENNKGVKFCVRSLS